MTQYIGFCSLLWLDILGRSYRDVHGHHIRTHSRIIFFHIGRPKETSRVCKVIAIDKRCGCLGNCAGILH